MCELVYSWSSSVESVMTIFIVDYEQSLFLLSLSNKTRENVHARD